MFDTDLKISEVTKFVEQVDLELKRAERYRVFMSLLIYDLSLITKASKFQSEKIGNLKTKLVKKMRVIDVVAQIDETKIALLLPETSRQGAELASKRLGAEINNWMKEEFTITMDHIVPKQIASFPNATGSDTIDQFLEEYQI